ncbi:type II toxin-antitoxin system HipA family toxin [Bradyrhizobium elkanii]|uniref:Serine/threonine-protein kinase HipA n=1 Tax=Bradyrhizobium elkanii TaxID=29448 RepID=A0ABV4EQP8_BRAEL|nr:type II toxin-antitoxin system HipA family toxin [Bradyrhizobium elkanii]MCP1758562.1 serine/threonine-protein kinase HipA [Bradyrhizobium elkanii]MCP1975876.1 serine/threonine-protein kinase HipA [Bradyrhizobium elkanii]MCP1985082.1 serine/threonine-protein kinase HipA [Bradyrhizobium elkanii]MCS3890549.1 serine/threonine-protein kinase HipA [Bradyrhizobium elkanii]MCS4112928.1 serine/threonine-protein kinase HipA [Bradyrhizobium elkanii]
MPGPDFCFIFAPGGYDEPEILPPQNPPVCLTGPDGEQKSTFPISLSLPLREDRYLGTAVTNVFDNLLPDSEPIRKRVAERVGAAGTDAYSMLSALGHDCVGALQFLPEGIEAGRAGAIDGKHISNDGIAEIIANLATAPLGLGEDDAFRISIAGAQEKTALLRREGKWYTPAGTTATTHILKPQIGRLPNGGDLSNSVENEYFCLKLLARLGIPTAHAEMADFGGRRTLVVQRFDRLWTADKRLLRLPQEDCCQALSIAPTRKYQSEGGPGLKEILELLKGSDVPGEDLATFMRAAIVFWLIGATDGHAKNFSIFLTPGGRFQLTPLYDVLSAQPSLDARQIQPKAFKLAMSVGKSRHYTVNEILPRHFLQTADLSKVISQASVRTLFIDLVSRFEEAFDEVTKGLPKSFPKDLTTSIRAAALHRIELIKDELKRNQH